MVIHKNLDSWMSNCNQQSNNLYGGNQLPNQPQPYVAQPTYPTYHVLQPPNAYYYAPQQAPQVIEWKNTFDMRKANLKSVQMCRQRRGGYPTREKESALVAKSLNLTRQNLQAVINRELDLVINRYIEKYFQPAVANLRKNLGNDAVNEDQIKTVCRSILEEAKQMYQPVQYRTSLPSPDCSDFENNGQISNSCNSRRAGENDADYLEASQSALNKKKAKVPVQRISKADTLKREAPKWDPERINKETLFVMGSRANKAMGFGPTRGRLYIKHQEIFRYSGDSEDKEWLVRHSLMPPTGQKAFVMIVDDIVELANTPEYRDSQTLMLHELKGFEAPEFMVLKIKNFMQHMRTDLPGGHRRYKRSNIGVNQAEAQMQQIDPAPSPAEQQQHQLTLMNDIGQMPCAAMTMNQPIAEPIYVPPNTTEDFTGQQINETLQLIAASQMADASLVNQAINFSVLWESQSTQDGHHQM